MSVFYHSFGDGPLATMPRYTHPQMDGLRLLNTEFMVQDNRGIASFKDWRLEGDSRLCDSEVNGPTIRSGGVAHRQWRSTPTGNSSRAGAARAPATVPPDLFYAS